MSSGGREEQFSALERIVSSDMMRAQNFAQCSLSEMLRALLNTSLGTDDVLAGGAYLQTLAQGNPVVGEILGGLLFLPQVNGTGSVVGPGVVCVYDPDASPNTDDSQYKMVQDPGSSSVVNASLSFTPNSSGSVRVDVVECSRVQPDSVIESDSRDIFNTVTGLFTAATVTKVTQSQMQYRIRLGTPGSGFPGTAQGWLPLAVVTVPNGALTWSTAGALCTIWDVRPLVEDRTFGITNVSQDLPRRTKLLHSSNVGTGAQHLLNGVVEATTGLTGRRVGGRMLRGSPGTDFAGYVDFSDGANQEAGLVLTGANPALIYYYLCTPFGLPRWARYTDASTGAMFPRSPRGIPVISKVPPSHVYGIATAGIGLSPLFGFGSVPTPGVCVGATTYFGGALGGQVTSDGWTTPAFPVNAVVAGAPITTAVASGSNGQNFPGSTPATIHVTSTTGFPSAGTFMLDNYAITYTGTSGGNQFTGCTGGNPANTMSTTDPVQNLVVQLVVTENTHWPAGATRLRVEISLDFLIPGSAPGVLQSVGLQPLVGFALATEELTQFDVVALPQMAVTPCNNFSGTAIVPLSWVAELEVPNHYPNVSTGDNWVVTIVLPVLQALGVGSSILWNGSAVQVLGWKYE